MSKQDEVTKPEPKGQVIPPNSAWVLRRVQFLENVRIHDAREERLTQQFDVKRFPEHTVKEGAAGLTIEYGTERTFVPWQQVVYAVYTPTLDTPMRGN